MVSSVQQFSAVIVDDETPARRFLKTMLAENCPEIQVVGEADSTESGVRLLQDVWPDVLFLDIQMPDGGGFELLRRLDRKDINLVFTTAYDEFALKAFAFSALDYLLKPVDPQDLKRVANRLSQFSKAPWQENLEVLIHNMKGAPKEHKIMLPTGEGYLITEIEKIIRVEGEGAYCKAFADDEQSFMLSKNLREMEDLLNASQFFRVHRSHLINLNHVRKYLKTEGGQVIMSDGSTVYISRRKRDEFIEKLKTHI